MTLKEYEGQKKILEQKIKELDDKWNAENRSVYDINIGKYYKSISGDKTIGIIIGFSSGKYSCKEITCDYGGVFIETLQDWSTTTMLSQFEFINKNDFEILFEEMVVQLRDKVSEFTIS